MAAVYYVEEREDGTRVRIPSHMLETQPSGGIDTTARTLSMIAIALWVVLVGALGLAAWRYAHHMDAQLDALQANIETQIGTSPLGEYTDCVLINTLRSMASMGRATPVSLEECQQVTANWYEEDILARAAPKPE